MNASSLPLHCIVRWQRSSVLAARILETIHIRTWTPRSHRCCSDTTGEELPLFAAHFRLERRGGAALARDVGRPGMEPHDRRAP